jgi:hypothetical protein
MLFNLGIFSPEMVSDARAKAVLQGASEAAGEVLRSTDLLSSAGRNGDPITQQILTQALLPGLSLSQALAAIEARPPQGTPTPNPQRKRESFSPEALLALDALEAVLLQGVGLFNGLALEILVCCVLDNLDDRTVFSVFDVPRAKFLFQQRIEQCFRPCQENGQHEGDMSRQTNGAPAEHVNGLLVPPEIAPSEDLTHRAQSAASIGAFPFDLDPTFKRLFETTTRVLHRRQGNHVLLTGERGVGKNTVISELARRAAMGEVPFLKNRRFLRVDCRYFAPDESRPRLTALLGWAAPRADLVLCLDGFPSLLAGGHKEANRAVLLSGLSQARCQFIGLLTPRDFEELVADDPEMCDFFSRVDVEEPDLEVAQKILQHFAQGLQHKYQVAIDTEAIRQAVVLSANYVLNDQLPAKALRILHRVCEDIDYERKQMGSQRDRVTVEDVVRVVADLSGVPEETLRGVAERSDYEQSLGQVILGQEQAVRAVAIELGLIKAGMTDPNKPAAVMLFLGQTGTGKTEMAKVLARFYSTSKRLKTYTLGNCVEPHSVSTIIGVPPGYVGHDQGGRLVNELNSDPYSVFLLDEADKAHPDVLQPFLNVLEPVRRRLGLRSTRRARLCQQVDFHPDHQRGPAHDRRDDSAREKHGGDLPADEGGPVPDSPHQVGPAGFHT